MTRKTRSKNSLKAATFSASLATRHLSLVIFLAVAALSTLMTSGCARGGGPGTLVIAIETPPRGFDPRFSSNNAISSRVMQLVYDTLLVKNEVFDFVPSLAESFEESADHKTFIFRLREGVRFHDGRPLTSADVKYTFDSLISPALKSPIRGAVDKIDTITAPDPTTVIFRAREPFYTFIGNLPAIGIIPQGAGAELINAPVGSGPYRFVSYKEGELLRLEANPDYWGGAPQIPRVSIKVVTDNSTRQAELMSGDVDLAYNAQFDPETIRALQNRPRMRVSVEPGANVDYLGVNLTPRSLLSNQNLRQAVAHAIDRQVIINRLLRDQAREANAILPPEHWAYWPGVTVYQYDPDRSKHLLDEAGYPDPDGDGPQPRLELKLMTSTNQLSRNIASILQEQLRSVGIRLNLETLELATLLDRAAKVQFDLYYLRALGFNQSTDAFQFVYHSRYQETEFNDAIVRLRAATDPSQMRPLLETITSILSRREYCPNPEVDRLADLAAALDPAADAAEMKRLYLQVAGLLTDRGGQNRMRYCNPEVDRLIVKAEVENDRGAKKSLYSKVQATVSDELPQIYLWYPANVLVTRSRVGNIEVDPSGSWYFIAKLTLTDE